MLEVIEWAGCITGLSGATLLAMNNRYSGWGFVLFLASNVAWIAFGLLSNATGMVVMQFGFTATSLMGVWKWLITPRAALSSIHKNGG
jgi:nicotinamide riboside transporter PnuC